LATFAKNQMTRPLTLPDTQALLALFKKTDISSAPFGKALDNNELVNGDPVKGPYDPILTDPQWLALQSICEG
jgi:hypothetical protein